MAKASNGRGRNQRALIAQAAARLVAEHGISDWGMAKRKAARQLGFSERETLPSNEEVEQALRDYHTLFQPEEQALSLREQRLNALAWMEELSAFRPALTGGVAEGWATQHSEVRLELTSDDPKAVERMLLNRGIRFQAVQGRPDQRDMGQLLVDTDHGPVRLVVFAPEQRSELVGAQSLGLTVAHPARAARHGPPAVRGNRGWASRPPGRQPPERSPSASHLAAVSAK